MKLLRQKSNSLPFNSVLHDDFFGPFFPMIDNTMTEWSPTLDILEDKDRITIKADLPGLKKEDIKVSLEEGVLTIAGERKTEEERKEDHYYHVERSYGRFSRSINLGSEVDQDKIKASYKDGVLELVVPKQPRAQKLIDVKVE